MSDNHISLTQATVPNNLHTIIRLRLIYQGTVKQLNNEIQIQIPKDPATVKSTYDRIVEKLNNDFKASEHSAPFTLLDEELAPINARNLLTLKDNSVILVFVGSSRQLVNSYVRDISFAPHYTAVTDAGNRPAKHQFRRNQFCRIC